MKDRPISPSPRQALARRAPWAVWFAVLLIVPGTLLSIALGAIGAVMLLALALDLAASPGMTTDGPPRLPAVVQLAIAAGFAAAVGAAIAVGAWII